MIRLQIQGNDEKEEKKKKISSINFRLFESKNPYENIQVEEIKKGKERNSNGEFGRIFELLKSIIDLKQY